MTEAIKCACGCGDPVRAARYPSTQPRFINGHQHRSEHNGNYRGGKATSVCPVCLKAFWTWESQKRVTCGDDSCYRQWQALKSKARGKARVTVQCDYCRQDVQLFPSQVKGKNYCNRHCLGKTKGHANNGRWLGGRWKWFKEQTMKRDGYRCVICGFDQLVDVHHIVGRKKGGKDEFSNLLTLCPNHHRMADLRLINVEHLSRQDWSPDGGAAGEAGMGESPEPRQSFT